MNSISTVSTTAVYGWVLVGWMPMAADYDGDGLADPAIRSESGQS